MLDAASWEEIESIPLHIGRRFFRIKGDDQPLPDADAGEVTGRSPSTAYLTHPAFPSPPPPPPPASSKHVERRPLNVSRPLGRFRLLVAVLVWMKKKENVLRAFYEATVFLFFLVSKRVLSVQLLKY